MDKAHLFRGGSDINPPINSPHPACSDTSSSTWADDQELSLRPLQKARTPDHGPPGFSI